jgi:cyclopropane-fatty-acyl-phospholipid synthase
MSEMPEMPELTLGAGPASRALPAPDALEKLARRFRAAGPLPCAFRLRAPGQVATVGEGEPAFEVVIHSHDGLRALLSLSELRIASAYIRGELDIEGDYVRAMWLRDVLDDGNLWLKTWRWLQPMFLGRERLNPEWIAKHYDAGNIQLFATDTEYHAYTPGIYVGDDDTLEESTERKYQAAFDALRLGEGSELLEIGCGWGGMTRFCASRGVRVTGITLSRDQQRYTAELIATRELSATALYQDFFTFQPGKRFDAISCMGVIEDLSDYPRVMARFAELLAPGGRAYLDFAAGKVPFGTSSFVTKHVWPGTFRMVYMPELMAAVDRSPLQLVELHNDRRNYYLWTRNGNRRWVENADAVIAQAGVETYRLFRVLFMGTAGVMSNPSQRVTAYRLVLELPAA